MDQYLRDLYYNSDLAYSGIAKLWRKIKDSDNKKIKYKELKQWLEQQEVYTMHKPAIKKFPYRKVYVSGIDDQWQADIVDMPNDQSKNHGYRYILTVIDVLSKYAWAIPLKSKRGIEMADSFELIFKDREPNKIQFDEGREFYNKYVKDIFENHEIEWFSTRSDKKASVVERFNRTLKSRMYKYFTDKQTRKWIDVLDRLVDGYNNNTYHNSIHMTPKEASLPKNENIVWYNLYGAYLTVEYGTPKFNIGDIKNVDIRITRYEVNKKATLRKATLRKAKTKTAAAGVAAFAAFAAFA
ncbi:SCAN domain-containing protein 3-like [Glandiceps talaboti]